ncbi:MAG TPA: hypothetical protein P5081_19455 [Phycisphaerae bacterium]|nr:hypothetical protein [Phycisphaerae bacterium]HRW55053.1 hypothetical protein [Phycisphaerae bacterium]
MRRLTFMNSLTLMACMSAAIAMGLGCDTSKSGGGANKNSNTAKHSDGDTGDHPSDSHDGDAKNNASAAGMKVADLDENGLARLSDIGIERHPSGVRPTNRRDATGDMIYAHVRVQMDNFIAERKEMLDSGLDLTDPAVRLKEDSIRKAVALLTENGETVEPIDPPIEGLRLEPFVSTDSHDDHSDHDGDDHAGHDHD